MIKRIHVEPVNRKAEYEVAGFLTRGEVTTAMNRMTDQVRCNTGYLGARFPPSAARSQTYGIMNGIEWTDGFQVGLLWLCYEYTGDGAFRDLALKSIDSSPNRVERRIKLDHHDLGFLYSLSCVAGYKLTDSARDRRAGLLAVDKLMERFQKKGGFIQAWGELGARDNYRLIIDCLLNIPPLHWAFLGTGNPVYRNVAVRHYEAACNNVIKGDASAYRTFCFDPGTGKSLKGATRQGYNDDSAWARGQAWGIYGIPLNYRYVEGDSAFNLFKGATSYFLNRLPEDEVCYWDLIFIDGSDQSRDSSAVAIGVCGIHEMLKCLSEVESDKNTYRHAMCCILRSLMERCTVPEIKPGNPVLLHGAYL